LNGFVTGFIGSPRGRRNIHKQASSREVPILLRLLLYAPVPAVEVNQQRNARDEQQRGTDYHYFRQSALLKKVQK